MSELKGFKKRLKEIDKLIESYERFKEDWPTVDFVDFSSTILKLEIERAELTSKIGVKK